jgi:hypothetical protein
MVLSWSGRYHEVYGLRQCSKDPSPLKVKNVGFTAEDGRDRRFVVCHNVEQAEKDREAIVASLQHFRAGILMIHVTQLSRSHSSKRAELGLTIDSTCAAGAAPAE